MRGEASHSEKLLHLIQETSRRHNTWQVFQDFVAMSAISIRNAVDFRDRDEYERQYLDAVKRYDKEEIDTFPKMLAELTLALEDEMSDVLGQIFSQLELGNRWKGQFFTPDCVCRMMAAMSYGEGMQSAISERGFITVGEPAVGGGAMVIAMAREIQSQGFNYQRVMHVTATDIDLRAVHMAYLQLSLLHIPALVIHGDTIRVTEHSRWFTPAHVWGFWDGKIHS